jgi:DNA polymerase-3 subunit beta
MKNGMMNVISTDRRRLAVCRAEVFEGSEGDAMLLPMKGIKELVRILGMIDQNLEVRVLYDGAQVFFVTEGVEFAVRKVESNFPEYTKRIPVSHGTSIEIDRTLLLAALERVDVVVRDYNRVVTVNLSGDECTLTGRSVEFGEAVENISCTIEGQALFTGFNSRFFFDAVKALDGDTAVLLLNTNNGAMVVESKDSDNFFSLLAPVSVSESDADSAESE